MDIEKEIMADDVAALSRRLHKAKKKNKAYRRTLRACAKVQRQIGGPGALYADVFEAIILEVEGGK